MGRGGKITDIRNQVSQRQAKGSNTKCHQLRPIYPIIHPNGHDFPEVIDESVPCKTAVPEDISPWDLKTRIESKFSSTNCQMDALIVNYRFKFEWRDGDLP
jgi:hypothetical protein